MKHSRLGGIAAANLRAHRNSFTAVFITVFTAALLVCALGVLFESGVRGGVPPHRLSGADVVVGAPQSLEVTEDVDQPYTERALLPESTVDELSALPDVRAAIGDVSVPMSDDSGRSFDAHGWSSAALAPYRITSGHQPTGPDEVVTTDPAQLGTPVTLRHGGIGDVYTVVGVAVTSSPEPGERPATLFLDDRRAHQLWPHSGRVAAIGLIGDDGVDAGALASRVRGHVPGVEVDTYTGASRADAEYVDIGAARGELIALSSALAGVALMIAVFVVSSTLSLSVQQRRHDFALLRAMGATPRQIHKLIGTETWLIACVAALLGVAPGYLLASVLRGQFAGAGILPSDFALAYGPVPALVAIVAVVATARLAAAVSARRPARLDPIDALRESAVEPEKMSRARTVLGLSAGLGGLVVALLPTFIPGPAGMASAGGSAVLLVIALALLGPALVGGAMRVVSGLMQRTGSAAPVLAAANLGANGRRLAAAITPLALAIAIGSVQLFSSSTVATAGEHQYQSGTTSDLVVTASAGISPDVATTIASMDSVRAVNPVTRTNAFFTTDSSDAPTTEAYSVQGIDPGAVPTTMDLDVRDGDLSELTVETVALSRDASSAMSAGVGDTVTLRLGDGAVVTPTVVATYNRGLGFGEITLAGSLVRQHTTTALVDQILVSAAPGRVGEARRAVEAMGGVTVMNGDGFAAAVGQEQRTQDSVNVVALAVLLGFLGIAVINSLVLMTSERRREFALLQLVGAAPRQVRGMMRWESLIALGLAAIVGTVIAYPPLAGIAVAVSGMPFPTVAPAAYGVIAGGTTLLGFAAITVTARQMVRRNSQSRF